MKRLLASLNPVGLLVGATLLGLSLTPSLLPRPAVLQGIGSGLLLGIGYAIGVGISALLSIWVKWRPSKQVRRVLSWIGWPLFAVIMIVGGFGRVAVQNEVRRMVQLPPVDGMNISGFVLALLVTSLFTLLIGRLCKIAWRKYISRLVSKGRDRKKALQQASLVTVAGFVAVLIVLGVALFTGLDVLYKSRNGSPQAGLTEPASTYRSAGADSEVRFDQLGRHGGDFIAGGPTAEEIESLTGTPAKTPIRVYVGLGAGGTLEERAAIAVRELKRTGAFERDVLMVATTTGSGWVEPQAVDSLEYLHSGNTASVALQFAYTPSFVSALLDPELPVQASAALFDAVRAEWLTHPADARPQLVVYGLSLGAQGTMNAFGSVDRMLDETEGALLVGPTPASPLWRELQETRDAGSPPWLPVRNEGAEVRWATMEGDFSSPSGPWNQPRIAIMQHATDPITWLTPELIWQRPEWLTGSDRAPDVSPHMTWIPIVTAVQVALDMAMSVEVPARHGHAFGDMMLYGWASVTGDGGLDQAAIDRIQTELETYWDINPVFE